MTFPKRISNSNLLLTKYTHMCNEIKYLFVCFRFVVTTLVKLIKSNMFTSLLSKNRQTSKQSRQSQVTEIKKFIFLFDHNTI